MAKRMPFPSIHNGMGELLYLFHCGQPASGNLLLLGRCIAADDLPLLPL